MLLDIGKLKAETIEVFLIKLQSTDEVDLSLFDFEEQKQILSYKTIYDQLCKSVSIFLMNALAKSLLQKNKFEKPFLLDGSKINFSISDCYPYVLFALSKIPLGVDIEKNTSFSNALLKKCFTENELLENIEPTLLWTMKEASYKVKGNRQFNPAKDEVILLKNNRLKFQNQNYYCIHPLVIKDYSLSIVSSIKPRKLNLSELSYSELKEKEINK